MGEKRYQEFTKNRTDSLRLGTLIWVCALTIALLVIKVNIVTSIILFVVALTLMAINIHSWKKIKDKLNGITDRAELYRQLEQDPKFFSEWKVLITKEYVLTDFEDVMIHPISAIEKIEVGIQADGYKPRRALFLAMKDGQKAKIAIAYEDSQMLEEFDKLYHTLSNLL